MKRLILGGTLSALLICAAGQVKAGVLLDQSFDGGDQGLTAGATGPFDQAQTFTVGVSGILDRIDVLIEHFHFAGFTGDLLFDIRPTVGGVPTESNTVVLASGTASPASVPTSFGFFSFDVRSFDVPVTPGEQLAIVLRSPLGTYSWEGQANSPYRGGDIFFRNGFDFLTWTSSGAENGSLSNAAFGFREFVDVPSTAVPEPTSLTLFWMAAVGLIGLVGSGQKKNCHTRRRIRLVLVATWAGCALASNAQAASISISDLGEGEPDVVLDGFDEVLLMLGDSDYVTMSAVLGTSTGVPGTATTEVVALTEPGGAAGGAISDLIRFETLDFTDGSQEIVLVFDSDGSASFDFDTHILKPFIVATIEETGDFQDLTALFGIDPDVLQIRVASDVETVPEPASLTLLGIGALVLIGSRWRRRKAAVRLCPGLIALSLLFANSLEATAGPLTFVRAIGSSGSGDGQLSLPIGVALDSSGNVWVGDQVNNRVEEFTGTGMFLQAFGSFGAGDGQFRESSGVAIDSSGNVWAVDSNNNRVQEFTSTGTFVQAFGSFGAANGQFKGPEFLALDSSGNVWISDTDNNRVQEFTSTGTFLQAFGSLGSGNGQLRTVQGVALDSAGNVWVADADNNRIEEFRNNGTFLQAFGSFGSGNGQFDFPTGLAIDPSDNVWVAENGGRIQEFTNTGIFLQAFGSFGAADGQFKFPQGVALDPSGNLWVVDEFNDRIQEFSQAPVPEPSTLALCCLGAGIVGIRSRRARSLRFPSWPPPSPAGSS